MADEREASLTRHRIPNLYRCIVTPGNHSSAVRAPSHTCNGGCVPLALELLTPGPAIFGRTFTGDTIFVVYDREIDSDEREYIYVRTAYIVED